MVMTRWWKHEHENEKGRSALRDEDNCAKVAVT